MSARRRENRLKPFLLNDLRRWLASPAVSGILFMIALLGIYAEVNSPGLGLPGAVAVIALSILFGSKFLIGMANWWEIAAFVLGFGLLLLEVFVIPGFGIAGISGLVLMFVALVAMMIGNPPDEWPKIPVSEWDWQQFQYHVTGMLLGFLGFLLGAYFLSRYLTRIPVASKLVLAAPSESAATGIIGAAGPAPEPEVQVGQEGLSANQLRPAGRGMFGNQRVDVVSQGGLIEANRKIIVVAIEGNRIVVKEIQS